MYIYRSSVKNHGIETSIPKKDDKNVFGNRISKWEYLLLYTLISTVCKFMYNHASVF